jgi:hypothetical protein
MVAAYQHYAKLCRIKRTTRICRAFGLDSRNAAGPPAGLFSEPSWSMELSRHLLKIFCGISRGADPYRVTTTDRPRCRDFSSISWNCLPAPFGFRQTASWRRATWSWCYAPKVPSAAVTAGRPRRFTFGQCEMVTPFHSGSTKAINKPKTSSGRSQSSQRRLFYVSKARESAV